MKTLNDHLALIEISGEDAAQFLHNQFTQSIIDLNNNQAKLFAYCNIKGRVMVNGIVYRNLNVYYLLVSNDLCAQFIKRLSMFRLRSKVKIKQCEDVILNYIEMNSVILEQQEHTFLSLSNHVENNTENFYIAWVNQRFIHIVLNNNIEDENNISNDVNIKQLSIQDWHLNTIKTLNLCLVNCNTTELYLPQMLNLDKLDGVNFKKGCYPGQEVVARTQYLGKIKKNIFYTCGLINNEEFHTKINNINDINKNLKQFNLDYDIDVVNAYNIDGILHMLICIRLEDIEKPDFKLYFVDNSMLNIINM